LNYSSSGTGGNNHFSGALFAAAAGIKLTHIPYKGIAPAVTALAAGEVELVIASAVSMNPQLKANRIRAIAITSAEPSRLLPGLPAIAQSGVPGYTYELWWGMFAPAGISNERVNFIQAAVNKVLASPDMKKFLDGESAEAWLLPVSQFADLLPKEIERYKKAAQLANVTAQ
jgi:tripartite-type tricarboxylate transporter receptor subunit TctC